MLVVFAWPNHRIVILLALLVLCIPGHGYLGFIPVRQGLPFGGLTTPREMFGLAIYLVRATAEV